MNGTATPNNPPVTDEDRQRGWAELEVELSGGGRESVRVHALDPAELLRLADLPPDVALAECLVKSLRADSSFVARIGPEYQVAIMTIQALLGGQEAEARAGVEAATRATIQLRKCGVWPAGGAGMRASIAGFSASVEAFKAATETLIQSSKIRPINPI